ncbi:hypothetical protein CMV_019027 [Castanea mollissima]|uniref:Uncharacterized protein n=1 Tax=Castanea mollissima TaxID=60419 RepID=A0A8J4VFA3_9ROSI|nr:hypothetical protein CMV_019027 [Castanea mollissima]
MILSSTGVRLNGMLRTKSTSSGGKSPFTKFRSHVLVNGLMRSETFPSSNPGTISDKTLGCSNDDHRKNSYEPISIFIILFEVLANLLGAWRVRILWLRE